MKEEPQTISAVITLKTAILFALVSLVLLTNCSKDPIDGFPTETVTGRDLVLYSGKVMTPATNSTSLPLCYNGNGTPLGIRPSDQLRIRFFDMTYKSHELSIAVPATISALIDQISSFAATAGATIVITPDNQGAYRLKLTGTSIINLTVENQTNSISSGLMSKVFSWDGTLTSAVSKGSCLTVADAASPLISLKDSSGATMGLESGDVIQVQEESKSIGLVTYAGQKVIVDSTNTVAAILSLLGSAIPKTKPFFGSAISTQGEGRVVIHSPQLDDPTYVARLIASNSNGNPITPSRFNLNFRFQ